MTAVSGPDREVVHACPPGDTGFTPCCDRTPFELDPRSRMTVDPALVTCGVVSGPDRAWLDQLGPDEGCTCAQPDPSLLADHEQSCALMLCHRCGMKRPDHIPGDDRCHPACGRQHLDDALPSLLAAARERDALRAAVERLAEEWRYKGEYGWGPWQAGEGPDIEGQALDDAALRLRNLVADTTGEA